MSFSSDDIFPDSDDGLGDLADQFLDSTDVDAILRENAPKKKRKRKVKKKTCIPEKKRANGPITQSSASILKDSLYLVQFVFFKVNQTSV